MKFIFLICVIGIVSCTKNNGTKLHKVTHKVWFDMNINKTYVGTIVIGLFGRTMPVTTKNFVTLASRPRGAGYIGSKLHSVDKDKFIIGGDYLGNDGRGGQSSYTSPWIEIENLDIINYGVGWVASEAYGTFHTSLFLITLQRLPQLDGISPVFGKVLSGINVVRQISHVPADYTLIPLVQVSISDCGAEMVDPPFFVDTSDAIR